MKNIVILLLMALPVFLNAQEYDVINSSLSEDVNVLYLGFDNEIRLIPNDNSVGLNCRNCSIRRSAGNYIVRPGNSAFAELIIVEPNGDQNDTVKIEKFEVQPLPTPSVYINGELSKGTFNSDLLYVRVKYAPNVPLESNFNVQGWQMLISGELYFGKGDRFPQMINDAIATLSKGSTVSLQLDVEGPDGIVRRKGIELTKE